MRLWTIHPSLLDSKGIVALWREALLAQAVLLGNTIGYKNHPQLIRFQNCIDPIGAMGKYLFYVKLESVLRAYNFDESKIYRINHNVKLLTTNGQLDFEHSHLIKKLEVRNKVWLRGLREKNEFFAHPIFTIVKGQTELWERKKA
jgi:hypothetical protein